MRIAYVSQGYPPQIGGVETHVAEIATRIAAAGNQVEVLTSAEDGEQSIAEVSGVVVRRFPGAFFRGRFAVPWRLWRYVRARRDRWDLVHAHDYSSPTALGPALARVRPFVFTPHFHGGGHSTASRARHLLYRPAAALVFGRATAVICVSRAEADLLTNDRPALADRIHVIPNGTSRTPAEPGPGPRRPVALSVGRLEPYKRVDRIVAAVPFLGPDLTLEVIGDGAAREDLGALAASAGVADRIRFCGSVSDAALERALDESRVLVTMSSHEAFGLAPLDALAVGMPVVASDIPAHRELRDRYGNGRISLVPLDTPPQALAREIERAAAAGVRTPPDDLPTWDRVAEATLELYRSLAGSS